MSATRRKHSASATLEPPNLWTTQEAVLAIRIGDFSATEGCEKRPWDSTDGPLPPQLHTPRFRSPDAAIVTESGPPRHNRAAWNPLLPPCCPSTSASARPGAR